MTSRKSNSSNNFNEQPTSSSTGSRTQYYDTGEQVTIRGIEEHLIIIRRALLSIIAYNICLNNSLLFITNLRITLNNTKQGLGFRV